MSLTRFQGRIFELVRRSLPLLGVVLGLLIFTYLFYLHLFIGNWWFKLVVLGLSSIGLPAGFYLVGRHFRSLMGAYAGGKASLRGILGQTALLLAALSAMVWVREACGPRVAALRPAIDNNGSGVKLYPASEITGMAKAKMDEGEKDRADMAAAGVRDRPDSGPLPPGYVKPNSGEPPFEEVRDRLNKDGREEKLFENEPFLNTDKEFEAKAIRAMKLGPAFDCAFRGDQEGLKTLLEKKENAKLCDSDGATPLHWVMKGRPSDRQKDLAKMLLDAGAEVNAADRHGKTPLIDVMGCRMDCSEIVKYLLERGADPNAKTADGYTPLLLVVKYETELEEERLFCFYPSIKIAALLLAHGADMELKTAGAWTPLMYASFLAKPAAVGFLLEKEADFRPRDTGGRTALILAQGGIRFHSFGWRIIFHGLSPHSTSRLLKKRT